MRCSCCDNILTDFEATRRFKSSGEFADMCNGCVKELPPGIEFIVRSDLVGETSPEEYDFGDEDSEDTRIPTD